MAPTWLALSPTASDEGQIRDDYESDSDEERQHSPTSPNNDASSITLLEGEALVTCDEVRVISLSFPSNLFPPQSNRPLWPQSLHTQTHNKTIENPQPPVLLRQPI